MAEGTVGANPSDAHLVVWADVAAGPTAVHAVLSRTLIAKPVIATELGGRTQDRATRALCAHTGARRAGSLAIAGAAPPAGDAAAVAAAAVGERKAGHAAAAGIKKVDFAAWHDVAVGITFVAIGPTQPVSAAGAGVEIARAEVATGATILDVREQIDTAAPAAGLARATGHLTPTAVIRIGAEIHALLGAFAQGVQALH